MVTFVYFKNMYCLSGMLMIDATVIVLSYSLSNCLDLLLEFLERHRYRTLFEDLLERSISVSINKEDQSGMSQEMKDRLVRETRGCKSTY